MQKLQMTIKIPEQEMFHANLNCVRNGIHDFLKTLYPEDILKLLKLEMTLLCCKRDFDRLMVEIDNEIRDYYKNYDRYFPKVHYVKNNEFLIHNPYCRGIITLLPKYEPVIGLTLSKETETRNNGEGILIIDSIDFSEVSQALDYFNKCHTSIFHKEITESIF